MKHKTTCVSRTTGSGVLGDWVKLQRKHYKEGKLSKDQIARLESIGFVLVYNFDVNNWNEMYERLVGYKWKHMTTRVPRRRKTRLATWVYEQRLQYKNGQLPKEKIDRLEEIGFSWGDEIVAKRDHQWNEMYARLVRYKTIHNHTIVSTRIHPELGIWVFNQRVRCKEKDRVDRLDAIGFVWSQP